MTLTEQLPATKARAARGPSRQQVNDVLLGIVGGLIITAKHEDLQAARLILEMVLPNTKPLHEAAHLSIATGIGLVDLREATSAQLEQILGGSAAEFAVLALTEIEKVITEGR